MVIEMIDKWVTGLRFNEIKNGEKKKERKKKMKERKKRERKRKEKKVSWFLIDFIFCKLAETAVSGSPSVT